MAEPPVSCTIEPSENKKLVYLPLALPSPDSGGMVNFRLTLTYPAGASGPPALELTELTVSFPGSAVPSSTFARAGTLKRGETLSTQLDDKQQEGDKDRESIKIPSPAPANINIAVAFEDFDPKTFSWALAPYIGPTGLGSYAFPFKAKDLGLSEYIAPGARHMEGGHHYGYDFSATKWDPVSESFKTRTSNENADHAVWGKPVYAMADGIVVRSSHGWPDNPRRGTRTLLRPGALERGPCGLVSIACISQTVGEATSHRIFTLVTDDDARLVLLGFEAEADSTGMAYKSKSTPGVTYDGDEISLASLSATKLASAIASHGSGLLTLWRVDKAFTKIDAVDSVVLADTQAVKIERLSGTRVVMARQPSRGPFEVSIWGLADNEDLPASALMAATAGGPASEFSLTRISLTRFVTAVRTASGTAKVIVWEIELDGAGNAVKIVRGKDHDTLEAASHVVVEKGAEDEQFVLATRNGDDNLAVYWYNITASASPVVMDSSTGGGASLVAGTLFKRECVGTAVRKAGGGLRFTGWEIDTGTLTRLFDYDDPGGDVTAIAVGHVATESEMAAAAVRTASGKLKVILWRLTEANSFTILHGDEIVSYGHLQNRNLDGKPFPAEGQTVLEGQQLGFAGNSGTAAGPHLHVNAEKIRDPEIKDLSDTKKIIERYKADTLRTTYRPMTFHGVQATLLSGLKPGPWQQNDFRVVKDQGFYFDSYAIFPRLPTLCETLAAQIADKQEQLELALELNEQGKPTNPVKADTLTAEIDELKAQSKAAGCP